MDPIVWFLSIIEQSQDTQKNTRMIMVRMLIDNSPLVLLLLGFAGGYPSAIGSRVEDLGAGMSAIGVDRAATASS
jgi:hypothetical protein